MTLQSDFATFLNDIRPTCNMRDDLIQGHTTLRNRLRADESLKQVVVCDFLQGSYRRATAVRPKNGRRSDVDIIVVTRLSEADHSPAEAMSRFEPFLDEHYKDKWRPQGRSFGIELSYVELDLVLTSAPSEAQVGILKSEAVTTDEDLEEARDWRLHGSWLALSSRERFNTAAMLAEAKAEPEWKTEPLRIPDRDTSIWEDTHPLEQIRWTRDKNRQTDGHFVNLVKALKWWRLEKHEEPKHPKGFPLERLIGECCPDGINSVAEGITRSLEAIVAEYRYLVMLGQKPQLPDYGVPGHDVFKRISAGDFAKFYEQAADAAQMARAALDSNDRTESARLWQELLWPKFPSPPTKTKGYSSPSAPAVPDSGRFA